VEAGSGPDPAVPVRRRRVRRRLIVAGAAALALLAGVLAVEVVVARNGPSLPNEDGYPTSQDGLVVPGEAPGGSPAASSRPVRIAWLGDSTAAGVGASSADQALPRQVARGLGRLVELRVLARSGARIADVVNEQAPKLAGLPAEEQPDIILVSVGSNDVTHLTSNNTFRSLYLGLLDKLPKRADKILLGVPDLGSAPRLAQPLRWIAGVRGGTLDSVVENMRDHGADYVNIADFTGPEFGAHPDRYFAADEFHPNDAGYGLWARTVLPVLKWRLYKREHPNDPEPLQPKEAKGTVKGSAP
jgi:lysophospholipase L1-like esterase